MPAARITVPATDTTPEHTIRPTSLRPGAPWTHQARYTISASGTIKGDVIKSRNYGSAVRWLASPGALYAGASHSFDTRAEAAAYVARLERKPRRTPQA